MRRNSITILIYLIFAALFLTMGPIMMKLLFGDMATRHGLPLHREKRIVEGNMPIDPEEMKRIFEPREWEIGNPRLKSNIISANKGTPFHTQIIPQDGKIDWHDYDLIKEEAKKTGPGEQGSAYILPGNQEKLKKTLYNVNGFNALASDKISINRSLKDIRHPGCMTKKYLAKLPDVSIVVPFHNEHWTTLLRTVNSVLNRSPKHLIKEIILVDDFSSKDFLKDKLDTYLKENHGDLVKIVRQKKREGLIRTRIAGAKVAKGEVLIFLDSHVEANVNWLPPLLEPIAENYRAVVCPFIDVIDYETFMLKSQDEGARGAFDWEFFYKRLPLLAEDRKHPTEPFNSPVMAGGLFAISTKWFWELGGYDPGLDIWGAEQYELSFKLWQCGGKMVDAPCSRVGHIYRKFAPFINPGVGDFISRNFKRVAEVWMDEYKEYLYLRKPNVKAIDAGDISAQLAIREKLHCKPFSWFMKEVAFDLPRRYPMIEPANVAEGELRNEKFNLCVDTKYKGEQDRFGLETCLTNNSQSSGEQGLSLTWHRDIRPLKRSMCFDASHSSSKSPVILYNCHGMHGNQWWKYNLETKQLFHPISNMCLDADGDQKEIFMESCNPSIKSQRWNWGSINKKQAEIEWLVLQEDVDRGL